MTLYSIRRIDGSVICEIEADTLRQAVEIAVERKISLVGAYLRGAYLGLANLRDAKLGGADLEGADLYRAYLGGAYLGLANLRDAKLGGADLEGADLEGAGLRGAYLDGAYLRGAYLHGANLREANLAEADLHGADLRWADLDGAKITEGHTITALVARATRIIEPYEFFLWATDKGDLITAGCRAMTIDEYRQHTDGYESADKREETLAILDYFAARWKAYQKKGSNE